jgi:hypothetical protein
MAPRWSSPSSSLSPGSTRFVCSFHALTCILGKSVRTLPARKLNKERSLTSLKEERMKVGAKATARACYATFQMASP